eukprot:m.92897 g.92897  ORF g.92897 m.92897 type:complete len:87 (-) comp12373_c0_seq6:198-458(-)
MCVCMCDFFHCLFLKGIERNSNEIDRAFPEHLARGLTVSGGEEEKVFIEQTNLVGTHPLDRETDRDGNIHTSLKLTSYRIHRKQVN